MRYALLIYADDTPAGQVGTEGRDAALAEYATYEAFNERYKDKIRGGEALRGVATATTVRMRGGQTLMTDGPFAETKEQLSGFYIVDCANLDEAVELAAHLPGAAGGSVEVRPVLEVDRG
jgi:hypothetical protein